MAVELLVCHPAIPEQILLLTALWLLLWLRQRLAFYLIETHSLDGYCFLTIVNNQQRLKTLCEAADEKVLVNESKKLEILQTLELFIKGAHTHNINYLVILHRVRNP